MRLPEPRPPAPVSEFRAGAAETDITPPPGLPLFGYAIGSAAPAAAGYRTRLKAHALVLEGPAGGRFAVVQTDLGATSRLLHQKLAERLAPLGIGPDRLLLGATHTHAGPGGFFGDAFYTVFGAGRPGYDERFFAWLVQRLVRAVNDAVADLKAAAVGTASIQATGIAFNRSLDAWRKNRCAGCGGPPLPEVDETLRLLRVDRIEHGTQRPLAAYAVFGVHGTAVSKHNDLYHGDVLGYAWRAFGERVRAEHPGGQGFTAAFLAGTEGDVSPLKTEQSFKEAERVGRALGAWAFRAFEAAEPEAADDFDLAHAYEEVPLPGAHTAQGSVCREPMIGVPTIAGAEDGPSALRGHFGVDEGRRRKTPQGCHGFKLAAFEAIQPALIRGYRLPNDPGSMPSIAPFQALALYRRSAPNNRPLFVLATVPGEPTTAVGHEVATRVSGALGGSRPLELERVAVVGLANAYLGYFTSAAEYSAQHYEGGSTFWGPLQSLLAAERLQEAAEHVRETIDERRRCTAYREAVEAGLDADEVSRRAVACRRAKRNAAARITGYAAELHQPAIRADFVGKRTDCDEHEASWVAGRLEPVDRQEPTAGVTFYFRGLDAAHLCSPPPIRLECDKPLSVPETDDGTRFDVRRRGDDRWRVVFFPLSSERGHGPCHLRVGRMLVSPEFTP